MVDGLSMIRSAIFDELFGCLDAFAREIKFSLLFSTLSQIGSCFSISSVISFECALSCSKTLSCRAAKFASSTFMFASAFNRKERESKFDDRCGECRAHLDEGGEVEGSARREFQLDLLRRGRGGLLNDAAHEQSTAVPLTTKRISPAQRSRVFTLSRTRHLRTRSGAATNTERQFSGNDSASRASLVAVGWTFEPLAERAQHRSQKRSRRLFECREQARTEVLLR